MDDIIIVMEECWNLGHRWLQFFLVGNDDDYCKLSAYVHACNGAARVPNAACVQCAVRNGVLSTMERYAMMDAMPSAEY